MFKNILGQKPGKSSPSVYRFGPAPQSIGRGLFSREGALDARESREWRDKIVPNISPEIIGKTQFWADLFTCFFVQCRPVAYKTIDSLDPPLQLREPKSKHISAETLPEQFHLIATSLNLAMGIRRRS